MALNVTSLEIAHHLNKKNKSRTSCSLNIIALLALLRKKWFKTQVFERRNSGFLQDIEPYNQNPGQRRFFTTGPRNDIPLLALGTVTVSQHSHIADYQSEKFLKRETLLISSQGLLGTELIAMTAGLGMGRSMSTDTTPPARHISTPS